jgi:hypothetical protein
MTTGTKLAAYEIVALIGAGGWASAYRARAVRLEPEVPKISA